MPVLTVDNVSFSYISGTPTLQNVSLEVKRGEFLTLVGPNGSGKSTLLKLLDRIYLPDAGSIRLDGKALSGYARPDLARKIAYVPQDRDTAFPFTVEEIVLMGRAPHAGGAMFESPHDRDIARRMMELTDIAHLASHPITNLSGGERQRAFIARALAQQPLVFLLDEPTAHLDIAHQVEIFRLLRSLSIDSGLTVVSVSHDLNLASMYSDRIAMLLCGALTAIGTPPSVLTVDRIREVFRADVVVDRHPAADTPRITIVR
ncbi:MAG TPA: ABC transporter ATP-binding protein [Bacteroidota bacterium]|nr:ABC transporter ATP-binding protein [Bacteroidota bacterium]